jgi:hypothetical protein
MAQVTLTIPDAALPRISEALKRILREGEAVDLQNPTNAELGAKLKSLCIDYIKATVKSLEQQINIEQFVFTDINIT